MGMEDSYVLSEPVAWEMYQQASREVRVLRRLVHDNILGLVGVAVAPLMLLLELAPLGDLKACVERFQKVNVKLNIWTLTSTLIQVRFILKVESRGSNLYGVSTSVPLGHGRLSLSTMSI